jgi:hypothetical protein
MFIINPDIFAKWFKSEVSNANREITAQDVRELTECGLIGRYKFYTRQDLETVRGILQYEQLLKNRQKRNEIKDAEGEIHCRRCGKLLPKQIATKK